MKELGLDVTMRAVQLLDESGKLGVIRDLVVKNNGNVDPATALDIGVEIMTGICSKKCADQTQELLAEVFEMSVEDIKTLPLRKLGPMFKELADKNDLGDFFKTCMRSVSQA